MEIDFKMPPFRAASSRPSVTPKKKRKPETAVFMLVAEAPADLMCSW